MNEILLFRTFLTTMLLSGAPQSDQLSLDVCLQDKSDPDAKLHTDAVVEVDKEKANDSLIEHEELVMSLFGDTLDRADYNALRNFCSMPRDKKYMEYKKHVKSIIAEAKMGNVRAIYHLACLKLAGMGVPQDIKEGLILLRRSALGGSLYAQVFYGKIYDDGLYGIRQNLVESLRWYRMAAKQGEPSSQTRLAVRYYHGDGVLQNLNYAFAWATIALSNPKTDNEQKRILEMIIGKSKDTLTPTEHKMIRKIIRKLSSDIINMEASTENQ